MPRRPETRPLLLGAIMTSLALGVGAADAQQKRQASPALDPTGKRPAPAPAPLPLPRQRLPRRHHDPGLTIQVPTEVRRIDGVGNNLDNPSWGSAALVYRRHVPAAYGDGTSSPAGADRPSARAVSNAVSTQTTSIPNKRGATDFLWGAVPTTVTRS